MLPKERKIPACARVQHIVTKGLRERFRLFSVRMLANRGKSYRFAVVVSSKIAPTAVGRNRLRRQLYEAIRTLPTPTLPQNGKPCYDVVVFANPLIKSAKFTDMVREASALFRRLSTL